MSLSDDIKSIGEQLSIIAHQLGRIETKVSAPQAPIPVLSPNERQMDTANKVTAVRTLLYSLQNNEKIEAIKCFRELTHCGLKEAKDYVEMLMRVYFPPDQEE